MAAALVGSLWWLREVRDDGHWSTAKGGKMTGEEEKKNQWGATAILFRSAAGEMERGETAGKKKKMPRGRR